MQTAKRNIKIFRGDKPEATSIKMLFKDDYEKYAAILLFPELENLSLSFDNTQFTKDMLIEIEELAMEFRTRIKAFDTSFIVQFNEDDELNVLREMGYQMDSVFVSNIEEATRFCLMILIHSGNW